MGGRGDTRGGRHTRPGLLRALLPVARGPLVGALAAAVAGVLLFCAPPGEPPAPAPAQGQVQAQVQAQVQGVHRHGSAHAVCVSPFDLPGCSALAHVTPGLLPVPPPAVTVAGGDPPPVAAAGAPGRIRAPLAFARAPDLHALQVLRT